jgi:non-specific serine/threonine protein kinase/serine/threonine-protein kinase
MADARWNRLRTLFDEARELTGEERSALLDRELADDPDLRGELDALLRAGDDATAFLADPERPAPGTTVGPYRLLEILGQGGFGVVYLAEQERPIRRRVALKLIKPGMDTRQVIARFEIERQALALMDHPGIAQVFDAGETEAGRPYFAMEYVPGVPITVYCDRERLKLGERLELFLAVCDAIQHAHQKGVIHRDIKPSNILVSMRDGAPALKVIDFGIAKATEAAGMDGPTMTREGTIVGTAGYMSPEQLGAITAPIDTRADIYSLGALLYELLTSDSPFGRDRLRGASWLDTLKIMLEDPTPPAVKAARSDTGEIARNRSTDSRSLIRALKGELEWITLKALEKEPDRRYSSASELAADVRRYLAHEPVMAAAPDTWYRVRKYARRHRVGVTAAALVLVAIVAGGIAAAVGFGRAVRAEQVARREAESSAQVADFLVTLFHASSPGASADSMRVRDLLDEGVRRIEKEPPDDPHVRARLLGAISDSYLNLGDFDEGIRLTRAALSAAESARPRDDVEVVRYLDKVINGYSMAARPDSIPPLIDRALSLLSKAPEGGEDLAVSLTYRKARFEMDRGDPRVADSLMDVAIRGAEALSKRDPSMLARLYATKGSLASWRMDLEVGKSAFLKAIDYAREANEPMREAGTRGRLAYIYLSMNKPDSALSQSEQGLALARKIYAPDHRSLADALSSQAHVLGFMQRYPEALAAQEEAVAILHRRGDQGEHLAYEVQVLAGQYQSAGRPDLAIARGTEAVALTEAVFGLDHFRTGEALANLARYHMWSDHLVAADTLFAKAVGIFDRIGEGTIVSPMARLDYGYLCLDLNKDRQADTLFARAEAGFDSANSGTRPRYAENLLGRARAGARLGRHAEASAMAEAGFRMRAEGLKADAPELLDPWLSWATVRYEVGDFDDAMVKIAAAVKCGATADDLKRFPELAPLASRPGYPLDNSP